MTVPGYKILSELGPGDLNRLVAPKMILAGALGGREELAHFRREAQAAVQLDHPNLIRTYDLGERQGDEPQSLFSLASTFRRRNGI
jgi:serine/threonine protein kinase